MVLSHFKKFADDAADVAGSAASTVAKAATDTVSGAISAATYLGSIPVDVAQAAFSGLTDNALTSYISAQITPVDVPSFCFPVSNNTDENHIVFDFTAYEQAVGASRLVSPRFVVWAPHSNLDRDLMAEDMVEAFERKFQKIQERAAKLRESSSGNRDKELTGSVESITTGVGSVAAASLLMIFFSGPLITVILGSLAVAGSAQASTELIQLLVRSVRYQLFGSDAESEAKELEAVYASKRAMLKKAIANLDIHVHPELQERARTFGQVIDEEPHANAPPLPVR